MYAIRSYYGKVLRKIGADEVIYPEEYMGRRIALAAMEPNVIEHIRFSKDFLLVEIKAPAIFENKSLLELNIRNNYNVNVVGVKREDGTLNANPTANTVVRSGDVLIVVTDAKTAHTLENLK